MSIKCCAQKIIKNIAGNDTTFYIKSKYYDGVIFPVSYKDTDPKIAFLPSANEIKESEISLAKIYNQVNLLGGKYFRNMIVDVSPHFANYKRQYFGYVNDKGQRVVYINLLNFKNKEDVNKYLTNWKHKFIVGYDGFFEHSMAQFSYNLATREIVAGDE